MRCTSLWSLAALIAALTDGSARAAAQTRFQDGPTFATMDRQDGTSFVGLQLAYTPLAQTAGRDPDVQGLTAVRLDLYGQYVLRSGLGFYGILPASHLFAEVLADETALGNVEAGGLYVLSPGGAFELVVRGGVTFPTADDHGQGGLLTGIDANRLSSWARLTDFAQTWPETSWARVAVSPIFQRNGLVLRADLGVDSAAATPDDDPGPILRANLGGGLDAGDLALLIETVTIATPDQEPFLEYEDLVHTLSFSLRLRVGRLQPSLAVGGVPFNDSIKDYLEWFLIAGLQASL
jgi:hypothetical protein